MRGSGRGVIAAGAFLLTSLIPFLALADVVTDGTLGDGSSPVGPDFWITEAMGERPGGGPNLFHSFFEFNLDEAQSATFDGPDAVENILGRVTGGSRSEIFGAIHTAPSLGSVDLYLMNPSGIVFGESASLDINGSFHATTADYIGLGAGGERFYADPSQPSLLSAAPPSAFGFLGGGAADDGLAAVSVEGANLEVPNGESLSLIGRDVGSGGIEISGAHLRAAGGRIDLASVGSAGEVRLGAEESLDSPDVSSFEALGALDIVSGASAEVSGDPPGSVWIRGGRLVVEDSKVLAVHKGANPGSGRISIGADESVLVWQEARIDAGTVAYGDGGEIEVTAPEFTIDDSKVTTSTAVASEGDAGDIRLDVGTLVIRNGVGITVPILPYGVVADTWGSGAGGAIVITAESIELTAASGISARSVGPFAKRAPDAAPGDPGPDAGTIEIDAESLVITDDAYVAAATAFGSEGDAGTIDLDVGTLRVDGTPPPDGYSGPGYGAIVSVGSAWGTTTGKGGLIDITADSVEVLNSAAIFASSFGVASGDAGDIVIRADSVLVHGIVYSDFNRKDVGGNIQATTQGAGDAGTVSIEADSVRVLDGGRIEAGTVGAGKGGTIDIDARSLEIRDGGLIVANAFLESTGDAGTVDIEASSVEIRGAGLIAADTWAAGDAGTVDIHAGSVNIRDGGQVGASANLGSAGDAGTITVEASDSVFISHAGGDRLSLSDIIGGGVAPTGIYSGTVQAGDSGSITVSAPEITVTEGAMVATTTLGGGDAGNVTLRGDRITISGGGFVDSTSVPVEELPGGEAGSVMLEATESITVEGRSAFGDQSRVTSITLGPSEAGSVAMRAPRILVNDGVIATLSAASPDMESGGRAGEIVLEAEELHVIGGGRVDSSSFTAGQAGSIRVVASESLLVEGRGSGISSRTGGPGPGGDVALRARRIEVSDGGEVSAESSAGLQETNDFFAFLDDEGLIEAPPAVATGNAGSVTLEADQVLVYGGSIAAYSEAADGGGATILATEVLHLIDGEITASVSSGSGGNIVIDPVFVILEGESRIVAQAIEGSGGNISITTDALLASQESVISASSQLGVQGTVEIHSPETDVAGTLASLPETFLEAAALMRERCAARKGGESAGSFVWTGRQGVSSSPDGMIPASYREAEERPAPAGLVLGTNPTTGERVALLVGCGRGEETSRR